MWPFPLLVWASYRAAGAAQVLCCALCCRAWVWAVKWYYSQGSSTAASKEIRIDTRSARKRGGNTSVGHNVVWLALATPVPSISWMFPLLPLSSRLCQANTSGSQTRGKMSMSQYFSSILLSSAFCPQRPSIKTYLHWSPFPAQVFRCRKCCNRPRIPHLFISSLRQIQVRQLQITASILSSAPSKG